MSQIEPIQMVQKIHESSAPSIKRRMDQTREKKSEFKATLLEIHELQYVTIIPQSINLEIAWILKYEKINKNREKANTCSACAGKLGDEPDSLRESISSPTL